MSLKKHNNLNGVYKGYLYLMFGLRYSFKILVLCLAVFVAIARPAYSYIDPGSGSMIWQIIVSAIIGMAFYFRKFITGVLSRFKKGSDR